jgi:Sec-independent protein translocase protein TatA
MEILNIGPLELIIILALMFILLGPKEMVLTAHRIGAWVRNFLRSPMWREIWGISQDIRELPKKIVSESGLEETMEELKQTTQEATDEINKELKEVAEAARVPEAEHMRIEPNAVPASSSISQAGKDFADKISAKLDVAHSAKTTEGGEEIGEEPAAIEVADAEASSAPKRRGRPKKADKAPVEAVQEVPAAQATTTKQESPAIEEKPAVSEKPAAQPAGGMRRMPVLAGVAQRAPMTPKAVEPEKTAGPNTTAVQETSAEAQPAAVLPVVDAPGEQAAPAQQAAPVTQAAPANQAEAKRRGRPKKEPAVVPVVEEEPLAESAKAPARDNGAADSPEAGRAEEGEAAPVRKPRKPRTASKQPGNGTEPE